MTLTLRVKSYQGAAPALDIVRKFDQRGGVIGRSKDCALALDDPGKYISRTHAKVEFRDNAWIYTDTGSNPSLINDRPLGSGREVRLADGDLLVLGDYVIEVALAGMLPEAFNRPDATSGDPPWSGSGEQAVRGLDDLGSVDLLGNGNAPPAGFGQPRAAPPPSFQAGNSGLRLSPDFLGTAPPAAPPSGVPGFRGSEFDHLPSVNQAFPTQTPPASPPGGGLRIPEGFDFLSDDPAPSAQSPFAPQAGGRPTLPLPAVGASPLPAPPAPPRRTPPVAQEPATPPPPRVPAPVARAATPPRAAEPAPTDAAVLAALLEGLGASDWATPADGGVELARVVGQVLREALAGTMEVLRARAMAKTEFQIESTVMLERDNNPLKFFPDVDMALAQMFGRPLRGYLPPTAAIRGAFNDLKAHEVATLAGMQGAVQGVIARLDPAAIEQRLGDKGGLSSVLPGQRKARLWDALTEQHQQLARAAGDDFQRVFGEAFAKAYRAQLEQLRHSSPR